MKAIRSSRLEVALRNSHNLSCLQSPVVEFDSFHARIYRVRPGPQFYRASRRPHDRQRISRRELPVSVDLNRA